jgi:hypothetical protein
MPVQILKVQRPVSAARKSNLSYQLLAARPKSCPCYKAELFRGLQILAGIAEFAPRLNPRPFKTFT